MAIPLNSPTRNGAIRNLENIKRELKKMSEDMQKNVDRAAARAGAKIIKESADRLLPPWHRNKLDFVRSRRKSRGPNEVWQVGPVRGHWHLIFFEYGVDTHDIYPKGKLNTLIITTRGPNRERIFQSFIGKGKKVTNPGIPRTRFLSRGLYNSQSNALKAIGDKYWQRILKAKAKGVIR